MTSHAIIKEKFVFVTCLKEGTQTNATTLWDSSHYLLWRVIICDSLFSKVVAWSHYSLLGCYLECNCIMIELNARTYIRFIQSMTLNCITYIKMKLCNHHHSQIALLPIFRICCKFYPRWALFSLYSLLTHITPYLA